jgi:hypothetical protein
MACVRLCDGEAEPALDPGQDGVPYPVGADLLGFHPGQVLAQSLPQMVVPPGGNWRAVRVPQQALAGVQAASAFRVREQVGHQCRRDRLPAIRPALFVQPDQALLGVKIFRGKRQCPAASAGRLGVQSDDQRVKGRVVAGRSRHGAEGAEPAIGKRHTGAAQSARLWNPGRRVLVLGEDVVGDCVVIHAPQRADQMLGCAAPAAGVPAMNDVRLGVLGKLADLQGGHRGDEPRPPRFYHAVPVSAVDAARPVADSLGDTGDVIGERRDLRWSSMLLQQVGRVDAHLLQQQAGGGDVTGCGVLFAAHCGVSASLSAEW